MSQRIKSGTQTKPVEGKSSCCGAPVLLVGSTRQLRYYYCTGCEQACPSVRAA